jgi:Lysozyme like domain
VAVYSYAQLEQLWINNGGSKAMAPLAAAIAEAESSGQSKVTSSNPDGGTNVGPWQLDTLGKGSGYSVSQLQDPNTNARVAVSASSDGADWSAWETYVTGAYKPYLSNSTPPDPSVPAGGSGVVLASAGGPSTCVIGPLPHTSLCLLDKSQARAVIGGACLVAGALIILPGLIILVVSGFRGAGGPAAVAGTAAVLGRVPVYGRAVRGLA